MKFRKGAGKPKNSDEKDNVQEEIIERTREIELESEDPKELTEEMIEADSGQPNGELEQETATGEDTLEQEPFSETRIAELEDQLLRLRAEFANFKRRVEKERNSLSKFVKAAVYREIFPTLDDFERFFRHVEDRKESIDQEFIQGMEMIHRSLMSVLQRQGIQAILDTGVSFDPNLHEAMLTEKVEDPAQDRTVLQVLEAGYRLEDVVIRPARVKVGVYGES